MKQILSHNYCRAFLQIAGIMILTVIIFSQSAISQTSFKKYSGNPVLTAGPAGSWDEGVVMTGSVIYHNSKYHMWYDGYRDPINSFGYAYSDDGITWTKYSGNPVLVPGSAGAFDANLGGCYVLFFSGKFHMWYDGINAGVYKIGYAYSDDGIHWTKHPTSVFEKGAAGNWDVVLGGVGPVIKEDTLLKMFYWGKASTGSYMTCLATSPDSIHWTRYNSGNPVLAGGLTGAWDQYSQAPGAVLKNGGLYEMWYCNWTPSPYCIGYASSTNGGLNWNTYASNPILRGDAGTWDAFMTIWPMVVRRPDGHCLLYYTGANSVGTIQSIGLAIDSAITQLSGTLRAVPQQYSTIQLAIKAATDGDTVLVSEGTYYENINFLGKAITVASTYLTTGDTSHISRTIIDGSKPSNSDSGSVVYFISGEDTNSVLCGFTITGGTGTLNISGNRIGGGVHCRSAGARLTKNIITRNRIIAKNAIGGGLVAANVNSPFPFLILEGNSFRNNFVQATAGGGNSGGAHIDGLSARIVGNVFENDTVLATDNAFGGGMCFYGPTETGPFPDAYIHGNIFRANIVSATNQNAFGGGINMSWTGNTTISENIFEDNIATSGLSSCGGSGLLIDDGVNQGLTRRLVLRNRFLRNRANGVIAKGGAIEMYMTLATLDQNEFFDNSSVGSGGLGIGGGINSFQSSFRMENNIFSRNSSQYGGGINIDSPPAQGTEQLIINNTIFDNNATTGGGLHLSNGANAVILNNIFWGDTAATGKEISLSSSTGNINYCNIEGGWFGGIVNINADPQFVLPRIDSLRSTSPCIGAGRDTMTIGGILFAAPIVDFHGNPRPQPVGSRPDIGAEESPLQSPVGVVQEQQEIPKSFALAQNYPNPFNPTTTIEYQIPNQSYVTLKVFDLLGREAATLVNEKKDAGYYAVRFVANDLASGVYLYRIQAGSYVQTRKLILVR